MLCHGASLWCAESDRWCVCVFTVPSSRCSQKLVPQLAFVTRMGRMYDHDVGDGIVAPSPQRCAPKTAQSGDSAKGCQDGIAAGDVFGCVTSKWFRIQEYKRSFIFQRHVCYFRMSSSWDEFHLQKCVCVSYWYLYSYVHTSNNSAMYIDQFFFFRKRTWNVGNCKGKWRYQLK